MGEKAEATFRNLKKNLEAQRAKRDEYNLKVKEFSEAMRMLKERRDAVNAEVAKLKQERNAKQEETRLLGVRAKELRDKLKKMMVSGHSANEMKALLSKLEFDYETKPTSFQDEKKQVGRIEQTKREIGSQQAYEAEIGGMRDLERKINNLRSEAQIVHDKMLVLVKQGEKVHEEVGANQKQLSEAKAKADEAHGKFIEFANKLKELKAELKGEAEMELRKLVNTQLALEKEREGAVRVEAERLEKEIKTKRKFNIRELQILQHVGKDAAFIKRASEPEKEDSA